MNRSNRTTDDIQIQNMLRMQSFLYVSNLYRARSSDVSGVPWVLTWGSYLELRQPHNYKSYLAPAFMLVRCSQNYKSRTASHGSIIWPFASVGLKKYELPFSPLVSQDIMFCCELVMQPKGESLRLYQVQSLKPILTIKQ